MIKPAPRLSEIAAQFMRHDIEWSRGAYMIIDRRTANPIARLRPIPDTDRFELFEVRDVLWNLLEHAQLDAKQRKLIWPDAERLDLEQSIQRVQKKYPDFPRDEAEEFLLDWIDMGYDST